MIKCAYSNTAKGLLEDEADSIVNMVKDGVHSLFGVSPSDSEKRAWKNLVDNIRNEFKDMPTQLGSLRVLIEVGMPLSSTRADMIIFGKKDGIVRAILIEHKQWSDENIRIENGAIYVMDEEKLHPYLQAKGYADYLKDFVEGFDHMDIIPIVYLPNMENTEILATDGVGPIFGRNPKGALLRYIVHSFEKGLSDEEFHKIIEAQYKQSKTLTDQVVKAINNQKSWILVDEQLIVFEQIKRILKKIQSGDTKRKTVVIVKGEPGTGKTAVAMKILGYALSERYNSVYVTNSTALNITIMGILKSNGQYNLKGLFKKSHDFIDIEANTIDIAICDEAHRYRKSTSLRTKKSNESQIYQIINASKVSVFFVDENQIVRPGEEGTIAHIMNQARRHQADVYYYKLNAQFRNAGNDNFVKWLDYVLEIEHERVLPSQWKDDFEFRIFDGVENMEMKLKSNVASGHSARIVAGFVWPWSDPNRNGSLPLDIHIGDWRKPWNRKATGKIYDPTKHPYFDWATREEGQLDEVGCIYSVQGFEFDYIGVIFGDDLVIRDGKWVPQTDRSYDKLIRKNRPNNVLKLLKNTYRVLLSRGIKGCYVYFIDEETKKFFKNALLQER